MDIFQAFIAAEYFLSFFEGCLRHKADTLNELENQCRAKLGRQPSYYELIKSGVFDNFYKDVLLSSKKSFHWNTVRKYSVCNLKDGMAENNNVRRLLWGHTLSKVSNHSIAFPTDWLIKSVSLRTDGKPFDSHLGLVYRLFLFKISRKIDKTCKDFNNLACSDGKYYPYINFTHSVKVCSKFSSYANISSPYWTGKRYIGKSSIIDCL